MRFALVRFFILKRFFSSYMDDHCLAVCNFTYPFGIRASSVGFEETAAYECYQKERADNRIFNLRVIGSASVRLAL